MTEAMRQAAAVAGTDMVPVIQPDGISLATVGQIVAVPMAQLASISSLVQAQAAAIAALQGAPDPCQRLAGSLSPMTVQADSMDVAVAVPGLLRTDVVAIEGEADLPSGLSIGTFHPARDRDGVLNLQLVAGAVSVVLRAAVPLTVVALR